VSRKKGRSGKDRSETSSKDVLAPTSRGNVEGSQESGVGKQEEDEARKYVEERRDSIARGARRTRARFRL